VSSQPYAGVGRYVHSLIIATECMLVNPEDTSKSAHLPLFVDYEKLSPPSPYESCELGDPQPTVDELPHAKELPVTPLLCVR
jgi:hypothetical protein